MDLSPITFGIILPQKLHGKNSTNSKNYMVNLDENINSKEITIKISLDSGASTLIIRKHVWYKRQR